MVTKTEDFPALPGFYKLIFLYLEPLSTISPSIMAWIAPGSTWFWFQLVPSAGSPPPHLDDRTKMAIWQLGNCYLLLGLISSLVFRSLRDNLKHDPATQEKVLSASFTALALADVTHITITLVALPPEMRGNFLDWNSMTHGNITFTIFFLVMRLSWFSGVGRTKFGVSCQKLD